MNTNVATIAIALALAAAPASAQTEQTQQPPQTQGPMIVQRVHSGFLVAPDAKITEVDGKTGGLAGAYAGWLTDDRFFVGGGGYWLADQSRDRRMAYGGLVVQWLSRTDRAIGWSVKGLVGGGQATLGSTINPFDRLRDLRGVIDGRLIDGRIIDGRIINGRIDDLLRTSAGDLRVRVRQAFFVAEPEADLLLRVTDHMRVTVGAGYRAVAAERGRENRLRGAVGAIGLQIGGGN